MPEFITCAACNLRHTLRPDGICPRCKRVVGNEPIAAGGIYAPVVGGAVDPEGSFGLGCIVGVFFGLLGVIACHVLGRPATKSGANFGLLARIAVVAIMVIMMMATHGR